MRHLVISLLLGSGLLFTTVAQAEKLNVQLILSDSSPPYQQFATSLNQALASSKADILVAKSPDISGSKIDLIVAVGMKAAESAAAQTHTPVVAVMVPKAGYENLLAQFSSKKNNLSISAIYLDQPWDRRLDFLRAALPDQRRIGVLYTDGTHIDIAHLRENIANRGGTLVAKPVLSANGLFPALESILDDSDVLLAMPDSMIYNSSNIRNILLTSYRHGVPLVGLSLSYVNAGALCAIYTTPEQLGEQTGSTLISFARTRRLPASQFPADFTIAVNQQVARSLGIELQSQEVIRSRMIKSREDGQ